MHSKQEPEELLFTPKGVKSFSSELQLTYLWFVCMLYGEAVTDCTVLYLLASEGCEAVVSLWWLQVEGRVSPWEEFGDTAPFPG